MSPILLTSLVLLAVLVALVRSNRNADAAIWGGVIALTCIPVSSTSGAASRPVLNVADALAGLANPGVVTIASLFIVAAGIRESGALHLLTAPALSSSMGERQAQHRIMWPTAVLSCFFNNTPLVALLMPAVDEWARRHRVAVGRLLMPLSFAAILGGACTLIGTSTNLVINGWLVDTTDHPGLGMFEMTPLMLPIAVVGVLFVIYAGDWLLPRRTPVFEDLGDAREFVVEMQVENDSELIGKTIDEAGLRGLPGLFLIELQRGGEVLPAVSANVRLAGGDHLVFAGIVDSVVDLQRFSGLQPATNQVFKLDNDRVNRHLIEAVVSDSCPIVGLSIKAGQFRTLYSAAVIAVARNGERVGGKIGDIVLRVGDVLLLETRANFLEQQRNRRDFYLVSKVDADAPPDRRYSKIALAISAAMVLSVSFKWVPMVNASLLAALAMIVSGCIRADQARRAVDWEVVLVIAGALALGVALSNSGLAVFLGGMINALAAGEPTLLLALIYAVSAVLAGLVTAKASAALMLPIAVASADALGLNFMPLLMAVMLASSMALATPIGYPTNLMVYGPGGYRFGDYLRLGGPLTVLIGIVGCALIPHLWPW